MATIIQTLRNQSGALLTNYPVSFKAPLADHVIPNRSQLFIGGVAVPCTTTRLKSRANGSAYIDRIYAVIPSLPNGVDVRLELRNDAVAVNGAGLTKAQILATDFEAKWNFGAQVVSLRAMVAADKFNFEDVGAAATRIKIADWSLGGLGDVGPAAGMKAITCFAYVTFFSSGAIHYELMWEHSNSQILVYQGLAYTLQLTIGNATPVTLLNWTTPKNHAPGQLLTYDGWQNGTPSEQVDRKINLQQHSAAGVIPNYDQALLLNAADIDAEYATLPSGFDPHQLWDATAGLTVGGDNTNMQEGKYHAKALYGSWKAIKMMDVQHRQMAFSWTFRERDSARSNFGYPISQITRPDQCMVGPIGGCNSQIRSSLIPAASRMTWKDSSGSIIFDAGYSGAAPAGSPSEFNNRSFDAAHLPNPFIVPSFMYNSAFADEQQLALASWAEMNRYPSDNGPNRNIQYGDGNNFGFARHTTRSWRAQWYANLISKDGSFWDNKSSENLRSNIEFWSGVRGLPFASGTANYAHGIAKRADIFADPTNGTAFPPSGSWYHNSQPAQFSSNAPDGYSPSYAGFFTNAPDYVGYKNVATGNFNEAYIDMLLGLLKRGKAFQGSATSNLDGVTALAANHALWADGHLSDTSAPNATEQTKLKQLIFCHVMPASNPNTGAFLTSRYQAASFCVPAWFNGAGNVTDPPYAAGTGAQLGTSADSLPYTLRATLGLTGSEGYVANGAGVVVRAGIMENCSQQSQTFASQWDATRTSAPYEQFAKNPKSALAPFGPQSISSPLISAVTSGASPRTISGAGPTGTLIRIYKTGTQIIIAENIAVTGGSWTYSYAGPNGAYDIEATAISDVESPRSVTTQTFNITGSIAPTITSVASATLPSGTVPAYTATATGTAPIAFSISPAVAGWSINASTGVVTGPILTANQSITIVATNGVAPPASQVVSFTVSALPQLVINGLPSTTVTGNTYPITVTANGVAVAGAAITIDGNQVGVTNSLGQFNLVMPAIGFSIPVYADKVGYEQALQVINITAFPVGPTITSAASWTGTHGQTNTFTHTATSGTPPYVWSISNAPAGAIINPSTGVVTFPASIP